MTTLLPLHLRNSARHVGTDSKGRRYTAVGLDYSYRAGLNQMRNVRYLLEQTFPAMFRTMEDTLVVTVNAGGRYTVSSTAQRFPPQIVIAESVDCLRQHLQPHGVFGKHFKDVIRQLNEKGTARVPITLSLFLVRQPQ